MQQRKKDLKKAMDSLEKIEAGCFQLVHQYLTDRKPDALDFFLKQEVKLREALLENYKAVNNLDSSKYKNPTRAVTKIMRRADKSSKAIVFDFPLFEKE